MGDDGTTTAADVTSSASEYAGAWNEGEHVTTYKDIDNGRSINGEKLKTVNPKDKTQVKGTIATNKSDQAAKENKKD